MSMLCSNYQNKSIYSSYSSKHLSFLSRLTVCKQNTFKNVKRDNGCRENTANAMYIYGHFTMLNCCGHLQGI